MIRHRISFSGGESIEVNEGEFLSESLDVTNSPILFGCRTGICATCLVEVLEGTENLPPLGEEEAEVLEIYAEREHCRLSCQLKLSGPVKLNYLGK
ncbi:ferredoxin [bacterium (Candidatus Blackallbacteria) CG17_big_fil_post_rev_8_21_14_2_50_48_46]|uniref:Ferredoxin n=1 Tax=bacterium (Candidatus Blackallbacteria) CG17_big_fil_post_rev_8_21_14_2_50_48_46 TaxID=2014261 RepID=A0A2M7FXH0_9BACT|nr:MAG: ferredoxin [bacterium (Candidatus Blackallbacteria) CG18_big_fil_WC_8_21_14_2_50_49_26]PIW13985.1 MAG: ferredoxin [bacterium (Candidatus Blackallbacteria) CG17_big_fil_post_rev_8_21_14_2_50_48_46]PIW46836.1 MAG: ferredoxin [bacterium (Candidatus Blackallbacteria) CG13_big_fil_rev_8_21_14_2_50_49_14]